MMRRTVGLRRLLLPAATVLLLAGCGYDATPVPKPEQPTAAAPAPATCTTTAADLRSYSPSRSGGPAVNRIKRAGVLKVGVSADTLRMGARNPETNQLEGFDTDLAARIADDLGVKLQLRVINAAQRIELLASGDIDIVARNFTINCDRWKQIAFSAEYYHSGQKVLVRSDLAADYSGPQDLKDLRVCAPTGTTSIDNIRKKEPDAIPVTADNHTGCLVKLQQGEVDAITGDDTVLAGLSAQDPYADVPVDQAAFTDEPYGIGINKQDVDLVRYVNAVLADYIRTGAWQQSYDKWLKDVLGKPSAANPPQPAYGR